jgi:hypothetical protein
VYLTMGKALGVVAGNTSKARAKVTGQADSCLLLAMNI